MDEIAQHKQRQQQAKVQAAQAKQQQEAQKAFEEFSKLCAKVYKTEDGYNFIMNLFHTCGFFHPGLSPEMKDRPYEVQLAYEKGMKEYPNYVLNGLRNQGILFAPIAKKKEIIT